ncbi:MAG: hypothetical protein ABEJ79_00460 [Halolamina sp.]
MTTDPLDDVAVSETARAKRGRYLTPSQLGAALRAGEGRVYRQTSPNHDGLYADDEFVFRGTFDGQELDIVFAVERDPARVVVITQMSQHAESLRGRFYERIGDTAADAVERLRDER